MMTESTENAAPKSFGWVYLELMGHRQRIGIATEEEVAGSKLLRIDIPTDDKDEYVSEYYGAQAIYALRPISEEVAKEHYMRTDPRPSRPAEYKPPAQLTCDEDDDIPV